MGRNATGKMCEIQERSTEIPKNAAIQKRNLQQHNSNTYTHTPVHTLVLTETFTRKAC